MGEIVDVDADPVRIEVMPNSHSTPVKKKLDKDAALFGFAFSLVILAAGSYWVAIPFMRILGTVVTLMTGLYSLFNLRQVLKNAKKRTV